MLEELLNKDAELFLFLNGLGTTTWDGFWLLITNKLTTIPIYVLLIFVLYRKWGAKKTTAFFIFAILLITFSDQLANTFKFGFKRLRPCHNDSLGTLVRLVKSYCGGRYGYYSAHASTGMALALFFANALKKYFKFTFLPLIILAFIIGYSRIYIGVHYPLDVFTGFLFGGLSGILFYKLFQVFSLRYIKS